MLILLLYEAMRTELYYVDWQGPTDKVHTPKSVKLKDIKNITEL